METQTGRSFRKSLLVYGAIAAAAVAMSACAKGFKLDVKNIAGSKIQIVTPQTTPDNYIVPQFTLNLNASSTQSIVNFVSNHNEDAQKILNDPTFMGPPLISGKFDLMLLSLDANQSQSGAKSQIKMQVILSAAKKVELRLESSDAHMTLTNNAGALTLHGYWLVNDGKINTSIGIDAVVHRNFVSTSDPYTLDGTLSAVFGDDYESIGSFSLPLCSVVIDSSWLNDPDNNCANRYDP